MIKYFSLLLALLSIVSCRKQDVEDPVIVSWDSPAAMTQFQYGDNITIKGRALDETSLKSVKVEILHTDLSATGFSYEMQATTNDFQFSKSFTLDDKHMPSGTYYVKVIAIDRAGNWKSQFRQIFYSELPLALDNIYAVTKVSSGSYQLYETIGSATSIVSSYMGDFQDILANTYWQQLTLSGGSNGNLISLDMENDVTKWEKTPQTTSTPYHGKMHQTASDRNIYVSRGNNSVIAYDKDGYVKRTINLASNYYPDDIYQIDDYLIIEEKSTTQTFIRTYYLSTGSFSHEYLVNGDVVGMYAKDVNEMYLVTTSSLGNTLSIYYVEDNYTYEPHAVPNGTIHAVCQVDGNELFIAQSSGVLKYTYDNNSLINTIAQDASQLEYDYLNDRLVAAVGNEIQFYDRIGTYGGAITHSGTIDKFVLFYNK